MEKIVETKKCKNCGTQFNITDKDIEFYDRISPTFSTSIYACPAKICGESGTKGGQKKYLIPNPTFCPDCRSQRRLARRNEMKLYNRKCSLTGNNIISVYSPDKDYKIFDHNLRWGDNRNPLDYGIDFDFSRDFFSQFMELFKEVPLLSLYTSHGENSHYANHAGSLKNCYLVYASWGLEDSLYINRGVELQRSIDCLMNTKLNNCYECIDSNNCYKTFFAYNIEDCSNSYFLINCSNCDHCFMCSNLFNKSYCINNKQYTKEEYFNKIDTLLPTSYTKLQKKKSERLNMKQNSFHKDMNIKNSESCFGDCITNSKNCYYAYNVHGCEDCKYIDNTFPTLKNTYDGLGLGDNSDLGYELLDSGVNSYKTLFTFFVRDCSNIFYCYNVHNSQNLFGCIGLKNKEYCIFNKQYTKEEYEKLVPKIIEHMQSTGERGEFFPAKMSPFGYNETVAQEYFPLNQKDSLSKGYKRMEKEYPINVPEGLETIDAKDLPEKIDGISDNILNNAVICEVSKKPFRIVKQELNFYRKHNLPLPRKHPNLRHKERFNLRNPRKLFDRKCNKCGIEIKTTYSLDKIEKVYCEDCYNKEIYG